MKEAARTEGDGNRDKKGEFRTFALNIRVDRQGFGGVTLKIVSELRDTSQHFTQRKERNEHAKPYELRGSHGESDAWHVRSFFPQP